MVDSIRPLTDLTFPGDSAPAAPFSHGNKKFSNHKLWLRFPNREDPRLDMVKLVLSFFPGKQKAILYFDDIKKKVDLWCQIHPALVDDLKERLGEENVIVK